MTPAMIKPMHYARLRYARLLYAVLALLLTHCGTPATPAAEKAVVRQMDAARYMGRWYEIARLENRFEKGLEQVTATYTLQSDGTVKVINRGYNPQSGHWHEAIGKAKFAEAANADGSRTGKLKVSFFGPFYSDYHILALDARHEQYALVNSGMDYLWLLSRTPQLDEATQQALIKQAHALGFATEQLHFIHQRPTTSSQASPSQATP